MLSLIPLLPFTGFLINAIFGRRLTKGVSGAVACLAMLGAFGLSAMSAMQLLAIEPGPGRVIDQHLYTWIAAGSFTADLAFRLDPLSMLMILVITGIGSLIHIYSTAYMHEESGSEYARYFSYLNLFASFMLVLVLGSNLLVMFIGWEGVGLCSYLLIGFWFKKQSANDAGKKAFVVNRIGDFAFILGMCLTFVTFGTLDFREIAVKVAPMAAEIAVFGTLSIITLLFFVGATGKSAQIPLYVWLPDAMEGPTPVSALIHAATMVTAGVYMIGRNAELFGHAPQTLEIVAIIGAATALMAGTIGLVQNDIKRVLAYSTVSQLGYMFLAMGVGAFAGGVFHLYTHAFFKALMFLGSGAVIHALHGEQDIRRMGGLRKALPITYWTFMIGALAIAGVPLLSGFFSKDEILFQTFITGHRVLWAVGALTSLLTAIYMFRLVFLTFHGERAAAAHGHDAHGHAGHGAKAAHGGHGKDDHGHGGHLHDAPPAMAIPLVILALGSVLAGYVGVPHALGGENRIHGFLESSFHPASAGGHHSATASEPASHTGLSAEAVGEHGAEAGAPAADAHAAEATELTLMGVSSVIALLGIAIAAYFFLFNRALADSVASSFAAVHRTLLNKYWIDELYDAAIVQPLKWASDHVLWKVVDVWIIDGVVNGVGVFVRGSAALIRMAQTGSIRTYAASLVLGVVLVLGYYLMQ
jgi:NADH-quinone oxidoreductase subunit L